MIERDKVIKGLEECAGNGHCTKCQYGKERPVLSCKKLLADVLALLKPVSPTWQQGKAYCGSCGKRIPLKIGARFCHKCGQAVKWND